MVYHADQNGVFVFAFIELTRDASVSELKSFEFETSERVNSDQLLPFSNKEFLATKLLSISVSVIVSFAISALVTCPSIIFHEFTEFGANSLFPILFAAISDAVIDPSKIFAQLTLPAVRLFQFNSEDSSNTEFDPIFILPVVAIAPPISSNPVISFQTTDHHVGRSSRVGVYDVILLLKPDI
jgi:hypothetical protein